MAVTTDDILDTKESFNFLSGAKRVLVKVAMQEYAKRKCDEQKSICASTPAKNIEIRDDRFELQYRYDKILRADILDAPYPEIE